MGNLPIVERRHCHLGAGVCHDLSKVVKTAGFWLDLVFFVDVGCIPAGYEDVDTYLHMLSFACLHGDLWSKRSLPKQNYCIQDILCYPNREFACERLGVAYSYRWFDARGWPHLNVMGTSFSEENISGSVQRINHDLEESTVQRVVDKLGKG